MRPPSSASVLIVDDDDGKRLALRAVLAPLDYRIVEAASGVGALRCLLAEDFAVILLDVCMPVMDGFETAGLIRQRLRSEMTPIIFITAHGEDEIPQHDRYADGAVDFIFAPVSPDVLRAKVSVFASLFDRAALLAARSSEVQASADQLRMLADIAPIGIFQTDLKDRYTYTNSLWSEITGVTRADAAGQPWDIILDEEQRSAITALPEEEIIESGRFHRFEIKPPGVETRTVLLTARPVPDGDGGTAGWIGTLADVTEEVVARAAISTARDAAIAANEMQLAFAASASHELRTPTTSILGFTEAVLEGEELSAGDREALEVVLRNAKRLSTLIDDFLILGQVEIGPSMMQREPTPLRELVERVVETFSATAAQTGARLTVTEGCEILALADPQRLEQALTNLVSNALKFTPGGGDVRISLRGGAETAVLSVADTGIGIAPEDLEKIFDRFFRAEAPIEGATKGTGLGLAIARQMVAAQEGELCVTSTPGAGSTFTITLPLAPPDLVARAPLRQAASPSSKPSQLKLPPSCLTTPLTMRNLYS